ncbi:MAG: class I SAM-dependent methyltransferase [Clostridia bacterium]|nr:class I SAM-dependent methyltransferase [Clostridia bacterium]
MTNNAYSSFAEVYDQLMDDVDYDRWAGYYRDLLLEASGTTPGRMGRIVECACGTGNLTARLAKMGFQMLGVDLSRQMLRVAEAKMRTYGVNVPLVCQDMCRLEIPGRAGAVLCTCDGINYLHEPQDVLRFFRRAQTVLKPGGILCFDVSTRAKLEGQIGNAFLGEERPGMAYLWQNSWNEHTESVHMDITFFVQEQDGRYRRFREEHHLRAYSQAALKEMLTEAGFGKIECFGDMTGEASGPEDMRMHMRAIKD